MKAILEFNLPEDNQEFRLATNGLNLWLVLHDLDNFLRSQTKYAPDSMPEEAYKTYEEVRDKLFELMSQHRVDLDMVE